MFHKETDFKDTKIGNIPKTWHVDILSSLIEKDWITYHLDGNHGELYPREEEFVSQGIPFLSANMITNGNIDLTKAKYLTEESARQLTKGIAKDGDVLFAHNATVGPVSVLKTELPCVILGTTLTSYRCNSNHLHNQYIRYYMEGSHFQNQLQRIMKQTTRNQVPITAQRKLLFVIPSLQEQKNIAEVLSCVDLVIQKTDEVIAKTERLKKGLMQKLLTEGIGHKEFKDTEIGRIPEEWKIVSIGEVIKFIRSGISREFTTDDTGYAVIRSTNIYDSKLDTSEIRYWHLEDPQGKDLTGHVLDDRDILVNFINSIDQIGKSCIFVRQARDFIYTTNIFRIKLNESFLIHEYFHFFTQTDIYQRQIRRITKAAVHQASFTQDDFRRITIPLPSIMEQENIVSILACADRKLELEIIEKEQLTRIKQGLMDMLLTGKVRVGVNQDALQ